MYFQQGDVLLKKVQKVKNLKLVKSNVVHKGDNHSHDLSGDGKLYRDGKELYLKVKTTAKLKHSEHKTITLSKGIYKKEIVNEYDHFLEESRKVID